MNMRPASTTNRYTPLSATVNTLAPLLVVEISSPATNGTILPYNGHSTYVISACFSSSLTSSTNNFNVFINGELQPQGLYILRPTSPCTGMKGLFYNWADPPIGSNTIQVIYTNAVAPISDTRTFIVAPPLKISALGGDNNQLVIWNSAPGVNYEVLFTTNLTQPFQPLSGIIPSQGAAPRSYDDSTNAHWSRNFIQIEMVQ